MTASTQHAMVLLLALALAGCSALSRPYPSKSLHAMQFGDPPAPASAPLRTVVRVNRVQVAPPFDGESFVYRLGDSRYETDYYSGFIAAPARLLTTQIASWMARTGQFSAVVSGDNSADYQLCMETNVTAMYGRYAKAQTPQAVVEARFFLLDQNGGQYQVVFDRSYREAEDLHAKSPDPEELVRGWNVAWTRMLASFLNDVRASSKLAGAGENR